MDNPDTVVLSVVGISNVVVLGSLVFAAGGLVTKVKTLVIDVEVLLKEMGEIKLKVARLELLIERRKFPRRANDETNSEPST